MTEQIKEIITFVKSRHGQLTGIIEGKQYEIPVTDIYYIEAVDNTVFIYGQQNVYETPLIYAFYGTLLNIVMYAKKEFTLKQFLVRKAIQLILVEIIIITVAIPDEMIETGNTKVVVLK